MKKLTQNNLDEIMSKLFVIVGDVYTREITNTNGWYLKNTWSEEKQEEFKKYLIEYVRNNCKASKKEAIKFSDYFILNFGWRFDDK